MKQNYTISTENQQSLQHKRKAHVSKTLNIRQLKNNFTALLKPSLAFWACCMALLIFLPHHTFAQDGTNDPTFNTYDTTNRTRFNNTVWSIALQADGKILVGGGFTTYNGAASNRIARLNADGTLDNTFTVGTGFGNTVNSIALQADGKILVGGDFTIYNGTASRRIARLNADGTLDNTFTVGTGFNSAVYSIALQADGKILVGGAFTTYNGTARNYIARLNADGTLDNTFTVGTGFGNIVRSIALQADGKILVGGDFTAYNGIQRTRIARLLNCVVNRPVLLGGGNLCIGNEAVATVTSGTLPVSTSFSGDFSGALPTGWSKNLLAPNGDPSLGGNTGQPAVLNSNNTHHVSIKLPSSSSKITWKMAANGTHTPETGFDGDVLVQQYVSGSWQTISTTNSTVIHKNNPPGGGGNYTVGDVNINKDADSVRFILENKTLGRVAIDDIQVFANWEWFTGSCGGTKIGSGTSLNTYPTATTTYYVSTTAECGATACDSVTFTLPTQGVALSGSESATCPVKGNAPIHFYTASGNYIGAINPKGKDLGNVTMTAYVSAPQMMKDCNAPANPSYHTAYMGRSWYLTSDLFTSSAPFGGDVQVILPFTIGELTALSTSTLTPNNPKDDGADLSNIMLTKISGGTADGEATEDDCASGIIQGITADSSGTTIQGITADFVAFKVTEFSEFFLHKNNGNNSPLPITLTSFAGTCNNNAIQLTWKTATETNVNHYEIYHSRNGQVWDKVTEISAVGNSSTANIYQTTDERGIETIYYKLRSVDNDGTYEDFNPIAVKCNIKGQAWNLFPVPVETQVTIAIETDRAISDNIVIMDMNGRAIQTQAVNLEVGVNYIMLDVQNFAKGSYVIKMNNETEFKPLRLMKL